MFSLGLISILLFAWASHFYGRLTNLRTDRGVSVRDSVLKIVAATVGTPSSLRNSYVHSMNANSNPMLSNCVSANTTFIQPPAKPPVALQDCDATKSYPLYLYPPFYSYDQINGRISSSGNIAGPAGVPVLYDVNGVPCSIPPGATQYCPVQLTSAFRPQCPTLVPLGPPVAHCDVADLIAVDITVAAVPGAKPPPGQVAVNFPTVTDTFVIPVSDISGATPSIDAEVLPPVPSPSPTPSPTITGGGGGGGGGPPPTYPIPPPPLKCPGQTYQAGPNTCACPAGQTLVDPVNGICQSVGL